MTREAIVLVVAMGIGRVVMAAYDELAQSNSLQASGIVTPALEKALATRAEPIAAALVQEK